MSTTDYDGKERIDAIPERATVLGIDTEGRVHLFSHRHTTEIWVSDAAREYVELYERTTRPPSAWAQFVASDCGWDCRHRIEKPAGADLFDPEATPPTREEVF